MRPTKGQLEGRIMMAHVCSEKNMYASGNANMSLDYIGKPY